MDNNNMNVNQNVDTYTYAGDAYEAPIEAQGSNALAIVSLICGIISIVCCMGIGPLTGIAGIICGAIGKNKCPKAGMAKTGMGLSIGGIVLTVVVGIVYAILLAVGVVAEMSYY